MIENIELKKQRDNNLTLSTLGFKLEVQPYWLVKEMINQNSQHILDIMIEREFKGALDKFNDWHNGIVNSLPDGDVDAGDIEFVRHQRDVHVQEIQNVADISRHLLPLHSDSECIELTKEQLTAQEIAYSYWKYNSFYGFEKLV